jgi:hypothetical protein
MKVAFKKTSRYVERRIFGVQRLRVATTLTPNSTDDKFKPAVHASIGNVKFGSTPPSKKTSSRVPLSRKD